MLLGSEASPASSPSAARALGLEHERQQLRGAIDRQRAPGDLELLFHDGYIRLARNGVKRTRASTEQLHVRQLHAALRDPLRGGDGVLDRGWRRLVSELGVEFLLPEAVELFRKAGQTVEGEHLVIFDPDFILEQVALAPREFELQARNPSDSAHRRR